MFLHRLHLPQRLLLRSLFLRRMTTTPATSPLSIGDVTIPVISPAKCPALVPQGYLELFGEVDSPEVISHFRWMAQKHLLGQDMFLLSSPGPLTRHLILAMAELANWEVETLTLTKDTSEADIKQRREIVDGSVVFVDQAPVRAAIFGRLLLLDGIDKAERNVLPTLNNLLENREMALEDGRFLSLRPSSSSSSSSSPSTTSVMVTVHPLFRVAAIGSPVPPYPGRPLDPPLRSRFQSRFVDSLSVDTMLRCLDGQLHSHQPTMTTTSSASIVDRGDLQGLMNLYAAVQGLRAAAGDDKAALTAIPALSQRTLSHAVALLQRGKPLSLAVERSLPAGVFLDRKKHGDKMGQVLFPRVLAAHEKLMAQHSLSSSGSARQSNTSSSSSSTVIADALTLTSEQRRVASDIAEDLSLGRGVCLFGHKGSGKSHLLRAVGMLYSSDQNEQGHGRDCLTNPGQEQGEVGQGVAGNTGPRLRTFPLYQEMAARDLLQRRGTGKDNRTTWHDSPLIAAARSGDVCVMDGVDRVDAHGLLALARLANDGEIDLPSGERIKAHPSFRIVATADWPHHVEDARTRYFLTDLGLSYHALGVPSMADMKSAVESKVGALIRPSDSMLMNALLSLQQNTTAAEIRPSLRTALRAFETLRSLQTGTGDGVSVGQVREVLESSFLVRFLPMNAAAQFYEALTHAGLGLGEGGGMVFGLGSFSSVKTARGSELGEDEILVDTATNTLHVGPSVSCLRRNNFATAATHPVYPDTPSINMLVPNPMFFDNPLHARSLREMLRAFSRPGCSAPLLLIGNQGVGKNKLTDRLLFLLQAEREYIQLHRDTTIQSLTVIPRVEQGRITFEDSPLVRAARLGRVLVLDEADKAPLEVVCLLKGLVGDGELVLQDGRRLLDASRAIAEGHGLGLGETEGSGKDTASSLIVPIHPQFKLIVLANRPGHPFLGNNFFRECGDLFATLVVENLDVVSETTLLAQFAPSVSHTTLERLALSFSDLRGHYESGQLVYPYSAREAVAVARHLEAYNNNDNQKVSPASPSGSKHKGSDITEIGEALENILGFEALNAATRAFVADVFRQRGFTVEDSGLLSTGASPNSATATQRLSSRITGGMSRGGPRTGLGQPKHGKEDKDNKPHVGGNTWAGGSGGSDTAGLGGRGGPYRLDKGHPVHQISDEDKAMVSQESKDRARAIAQETFEAKLREIKMGKGDYAAYEKFKGRIGMQVQQIKDMLSEVVRRRSERVWLRNQHHGELDDGKIVDGLAGDRLVFKRRGVLDNSGLRSTSAGDAQGHEEAKRIVQFVVDVSGSMMRFNGYDGRLERMLETTLMIMEALPRRCNDNDGDRSSDSDSGNDNDTTNSELADLLEYSIAGHSGDTPCEVLVDFPSNAPASYNSSSDHQKTGEKQESVAEAANEKGFFRFLKRKKEAGAGTRSGALNEKAKMEVIETMIVHSQFCDAGDNTLGAIAHAVDRVIALGLGAHTNSNGIDGHSERMVIVVTDANFARYGITAEDLKVVMQRDDRVQVHLILIASLRDEADDLMATLPSGRCHACMDSALLPAVIRKILTAE